MGITRWVSVGYGTRRRLDEVVTPEGRRSLCDDAPTTDGGRSPASCWYGNRQSGNWQPNNGLGISECQIDVILVLRAIIPSHVTDVKAGPGHSSADGTRTLLESKLQKHTRVKNLSRW